MYVHQGPGMAQTIRANLNDCTAPCNTDKGTKIEPFALAALDLCRAGLAVLPVGGDDGKQPLVAWGKWRKRPGRNFMEKLAQRYVGANVGIITGLSDLTVVDCDAPEAVAAMIERCGDTPLKTSTPSGGVHLWYRSAGER